MKNPFTHMKQAVKRELLRPFMHKFMNDVTPKTKSSILDMVIEDKNRQTVKQLASFDACELAWTQWPLPKATTYLVVAMAPAGRVAYDISQVLARHTPGLDSLQGDEEDECDTTPDTSDDFDDDEDDENPLERGPHMYEQVFGRLPRHVVKFDIPITPNIAIFKNGFAGFPQTPDEDRPEGA